MDDYISREVAEQFICDVCERPGCPILWGGDCDRIDRLNKIPAADVRPVVKAHWIYHEDDYGDYYECSHCHDEYVVYENDMEWKFCPTCGADMREPNLDTTKGGG